MKAYADSNFFTRLYLPTPGSPVATALFLAAREMNWPLPITWLHRAEVVNALELNVFTSQFRGQTRISTQNAAIAQATFREDVRRSDFLRVAPLAPEKLQETFEELSLRHTARHGFRTYDILHVASALLLECDTFWSFDAKACRLADLEGMKLAKR